MMASLTERQEAFCRAIVLEGLGPSAAYRRAYESEMGADSVASNAKRLLRHDTVKAFLAELRGDAAAGEDGLTPQAAAFAFYILEGADPTIAYQRAYSVPPSTSPATVERNAKTLLASPKISARLAEIRVRLGGHQQ
jgi:hypothetical protein